MSNLPPPSYNDDQKSFAYATVHKRWPTIIQSGIKDLQSHIDKSPEHAKSGHDIISKLQGLLTDFISDRTVPQFTIDDIKLEKSLSHYNDHLTQLSKVKSPVTWQTGPWLFLECYLYQTIHLFHLQSSDSYWHTFDIFQVAKTSTFKQSELGVLELCKRYETLHQQLAHQSEDVLQILFTEFIDISLWGNATDLSLLAGNVSLQDIQSLQGAEVRKKNEEKIIVNDLPTAWQHFVNSDSKRVDIVLDNSGFELFADLILTLFLLDSKLANEVHIHCKEIPWFVSDTMPKDFHNLLNELIDPQFYQQIHSVESDKSAITHLHKSLSQYYQSGHLKVNHDPFWTLSQNYWDIPQFDQLYQDLAKSGLIIFKGDLNYRKLTGDLQWPKTTPFNQAIQQLANSNLPVLALRTCKADVAVGLPEGLHEKLSKTYADEGNEIGELWTASGKWAVISFSDGK